MKVCWPTPCPSNQQARQKPTSVRFVTAPIGSFISERTLREFAKLTICEMRKTIRTLKAKVPTTHNLNKVLNWCNSNWVWEAWTYVQMAGRGWHGGRPFGQRWPVTRLLTYFSRFDCEATNQWLCNAIQLGSFHISLIFSINSFLIDNQSFSNSKQYLLPLLWWKTLQNPPPQQNQSQDIPVKLKLGSQRHWIHLY